ncbi:hypothetical protein MHYP_G00034570 [Metynnis hypsauchen]
MQSQPKSSLRPNPGPGIPKAKTQGKKGKPNVGWGKGRRPLERFRGWKGRTEQGLLSLKSKAAVLNFNLRFLKNSPTAVLSRPKSKSNAP